MSAHKAGEVRRLLDQRLRLYEGECSGHAVPQSPQDAKDCLWNSVEVAHPCSAYLVLLSLKWCTDRSHAELETCFVIDLAVDILDTTSDWWVPYENGERTSYESSLEEGERQRALKQSEFDKWAFEDCVAVYKWLVHCVECRGSLPWLTTKLTQVTSYWRKRAETAT
jgi:hypothetical protein